MIVMDCRNRVLFMGVLLMLMISFCNFMGIWYVWYAGDILGFVYCGTKCRIQFIIWSWLGFSFVWCTGVGIIFVMCIFCVCMVTAIR